ncbi:MAG TPA: hypothetical protein VNL18_09915 [Gemmatimonadales bacterium]|nr:hypothetical protein [Gemmatimonadales bacterium]
MIRSWLFGAALTCIGALAPLAIRAQETPPARGKEAPPEISADQAPQYVGSTVTVCDSVASTRYAERSRGRPTFLNLGRAYPDQLLTVVIWGEYRDRFPEPPERAYLHRRVCATGTVRLYGGRPEIEVRDPAALRLQRKAPGS